jgi:hypothetical protein
MYLVRVLCVLTGLVAIQRLSASFFREVQGIPVEGLVPTVTAFATTEGYSVSISLEAASNVTGGVRLLRPRPNATVFAQLVGAKAKLQSTLHDADLSGQRMPQVISIPEYLAPIPFRDRPRMHLRMSPGPPMHVHTFILRNVVATGDSNEFTLVVTLVMYKCREDKQHADLLKWPPVEMVLPIAPPGSSQRPLAKATKANHPDPDWANPDRVAALADLPVPSASWLPWAAWGTAVAALVAAGLLYRCRRRAASREKSGN